MKATTFIAILLTFLMAILVLSAAVIFLFQGRQQMLDSESASATGVAALESTRVQLEASLGAEAAALATNQAILGTSEAEYASLEGQLIQSDQALAAATAALATVMAPTAIAPEALAPPTVEILEPQPFSVFNLDSALPIAFTVYHPAGLSRVQLQVQAEEVETQPVSGDPYQRFDASYDLSEAVIDDTQAIIVSVVATSTLNIPSAPKLVTITVSVPTPAPTTTPTASPTSTPAAPSTPPPTPTGAIDSPTWIVGLPSLLQVEVLDTRRLPGIELS